MFDASGGLALVIAGVGFYSIVIFTIAQGRHELGVRTPRASRRDRRGR